jgi:hypothetical protein
MDWIVFGLGKSVNLISDASEYNTIGVNDIDLYHTVDHLVIPDKWTAFTEPRLETIADTEAQTVWLKDLREFLGLELHPDIRYYKVYCWDHHKFLDPDQDRIPYHFTSPFLAACIAWKYLRAKRIGILGVDLLTDHHMSDNQAVVNRGFGELRQEMLKYGTELVNLSPIADLDSLPLKPLDFIRKKSCES